jgi:hypothetical protein
MPRAIGVVRSGRKDLSERVEELLKEGIGRRRPRLAVRFYVYKSKYAY